ncbi:MAG: hypothetical protein AAF902_23155 [Chloroflexota bacterium]
MCKQDVIVQRMRNSAPNSVLRDACCISVNTHAIRTTLQMPNLAQLHNYGGI